MSLSERGNELPLPGYMSLTRVVVVSARAEAAITSATTTTGQGAPEVPTHPLRVVPCHEATILLGSRRQTWPS